MPWAHLAIAAVALLGISLPGTAAAGTVGSPRGKACLRLPDNPNVLRAKAGHLRRDNVAARREGLSWLRDLVRVQRFTKWRILIRLAPETKTYHVAGVAPQLRVTRPWTKRFIEEFSRAFHDRFRTRLKITSLTRTAVAQRALRRANGNAAPADGHIRSTHLTGASVDISKRPLRDQELRWIRAALQRLVARRLLSATEEFRQPHFHVLVFRAYDDAPRGRLLASLPGCALP